ncbi:oxalocrotonate tautomerase [Penicillium longicatenatum]|uniref:oxalocrotonate tautomerase n=1 Tax=Penicillium longicatenatum TaxID=1561947 RepID=UPI0025469569|nr:oxalocrotonate tautomerase [Penicillium longicatenatum]KAJ5657567.1 oxalocrotonate tautomerase [Penicillium longicatenatum]
MPLWQIYHPHGTFEDDASKQAFADDITKMYVGFGLPAFYVVTQFHKMESNNVFVGGKIRTATDKPFVRVVINHVAVRIPDSDAAFLRTTSRLDEAMKPHLLDKGYDFEYTVEETERRLWKINGLIPPPNKSAEERVWAEENKPLPYEGAYPPK